MKDRQPPSDDQIKEYVALVLENSDLEKITMREVCSLVMNHYSDFELAHKRDVIKAAVKSIINAKPATEQEENVVKTEETSEVSAGRNANELETSQKWEAVENDLNLLEEAASRAPQSWGGIGSQPRQEEERMSLLEKLKDDESQAEPVSTTESQDASEQPDATEDEVDAESASNVSETEEVGCSSIYCVHREGGAGGRAPRRRRRPKTRVLKPSKLRPLTVLQRMIRLEERHLSLTRDNAIALNHVADSVDRLANFITECSRRIAGDIERRNTPN
ncbi:hypothetical protein PYW08_009269 [Mythimna loreyi]|uniref:Uncharacterized protein n=1 Tax=Mythimna loreyi TaxID=667449 RepID=A0ACC2QC12_9NEOP|nr:hypothetical protein PYW08_009269 [Mythimna loreyi]